MPKPRCSAEFLDESCRGPILVGSNGFADGGPTKDGKRTYRPIPVFQSPAHCSGAKPTSDVIMDLLGRKWGGNPKAAAVARRMNEQAIHYQPPGQNDDLIAGFLDDEWS